MTYEVSLAGLAGGAAMPSSLTYCLTDERQLAIRARTRPLCSKAGVSNSMTVAPALAREQQSLSLAGATFGADRASGQGLQQRLLLPHDEALVSCPQRRALRPCFHA